MSHPNHDFLDCPQAEAYEYMVDFVDSTKVSHVIFISHPPMIVHNGESWKHMATLHDDWLAATCTYRLVSTRSGLQAAECP